MKKHVVRIGLGIFSIAAAVTGMRLALEGLKWESFRTQVHLLDWRWLVIAVVFDVVSYAAQGLRWRLMLDGASFWHTTRAIYAGLFVNEVIPLRPGEVVRAWLASRDLRLGMWTIAGSMINERLMDAFWLVLALLGALAVAPLPAAWVEGILIGAGTMVLVLALVRHLAGKGFAFLANVRKGFQSPGALLVSGCFLLAQGLAFWAVVQASHLPLGLLSAFVVMIVVRIGTMIPGAPANLGTHQFATVFGLPLYGVTPVEAGTFSIVVLTLPLLLLGLGACLSAGLTWRNVSTLRKQAAT